MPVSHSSPKLAIFLELLRGMRMHAKLRQIDVDKQLGYQQSFVSKYESGERRLDLLELEQVCNACGSSLTELVTSYQRATRHLEPGR